MAHRQNAFTLVELLAALAILGVVAALAAAAAGNALDTARRTDALNHLRQLGVAVASHVSDHNGELPASQHQTVHPDRSKRRPTWRFSLRPYLGLSDTAGNAELKQVFRSPAEPNDAVDFSYAINDLITPGPGNARHLDYSRVHRLETPSQTVVFTEIMSDKDRRYTGGDHFHFAYGYAPSQFLNQVAGRRYSDGGLYLFADFHARWMTWEDVSDALTAPQSRFIHPEGNP